MVTSGGKLKVAVLMGGLSAERDISLSTGRQILERLDKSTYEAFAVDAALMPGSNLVHERGAGVEIWAVSEARQALDEMGGLASVTDMVEKRPDVVVIALHGKYGEDGTVQGMLELLGIPYTGSGVLASSLAMDKSMAKKVLAADGIPVPHSVDFSLSGEWDREAIAADVAALGYPVIVKPSRQGSTIGMTKVECPRELNNAIKEAAAYDSRIVIEKFITGMELTVGVLGNDAPYALPVVEIVPVTGFYDYEAKYTPGATEEIVPARISDELTNRAQDIAVKAHKALGCCGMCRVDMMLSGDGFSVLEVNTIPGMTPTSLLPRAAEAAGISFGELLDRLIGYALEEGSAR